MFLSLAGGVGIAGGVPLRRHGYSNIVTGALANCCGHNLHSDVQRGLVDVAGCVTNLVVTSDECAARSVIQLNLQHLSRNVDLVRIADEINASCC